MKSWLLDTNLLSEVVRKRPAPSVLERLRQAPAERLFTSAICVMELRFGAVRHPNGRLLWERIRREVLGRVTVLGVREAEGLRAGEIMANLEARGEKIGIEDVLIAATALTHDLAVATRNVRHLGRVEGLEVQSWWKE